MTIFVSFSLVLTAAQEYGIVRATTSNPHKEIFPHLYRLNYIVQERAYYSYFRRRICIEELFSLFSSRSIIRN